KMGWNFVTNFLPNYLCLKSILSGMGSVVQSSRCLSHCASAHPSKQTKPSRVGSGSSWETVVSGLTTTPYILPTQPQKSTKFSTGSSIGLTVQMEKEDSSLFGRRTTINVKLSYGTS